MPVDLSGVTRPRSSILAVAAVAAGLAGCWFAGLATQPVRSAAVYLAYVVVVIALPGVVLLRRLTGGLGWRYADIVLGAVFGLALEMPCYLLGRGIGLPRLPLVLPVVAAVVWRQGRSGPRAAVRPLSRAALAGTFAGPALLAAWYARVGSQYIPLDGPLALRPNSDTPYQLAVAGELAHHFPPQVPYVAGEPLHYHWMAYGHVASAHWATGIELDRLVSVLVPYLLLSLLVTGISAVTLVLSGRAAAAATGGLAAVVAGDFGPWSWTDLSGFLTDTPVSFSSIVSPTQTTAAVLMLPLVAVTAELYRRRDRDQPAGGCWAVAAVLLLVMSATKATALPVFGAGLATVFGYRLLVRPRRVDTTGLLLAGFVAGSYLLSYYLVLGGTAAGMTTGAGESYRQLLEVIVGSKLTTAVGGAGIVLLAALLVLGWLLPAVAVALVPHRPDRLDPGLVMCLGSLLGAVAGFSVVSHWSVSQLFLVRTGAVFGVLLIAWGLACLPRSSLRYAVPALLAGAGVSVATRRLFPAPPNGCADAGCAVERIALPPVTALAAGLVAAALVVLALRAPARARLPSVACALLGLTLAPSLGQLRSPAPITTAQPSIPDGGISAARYIRGHSPPHELVATNVHCRTPNQDPCSPMSFWLAGYAERRVLVQGWAYVSRTNAAPDRAAALSGPFWDPSRLTANDAVFTDPTEANLAVLRDRYGVRWLLADRRVRPVPSRLATLTDLRFTAGDTQVYRLRPAAPDDDR